MKTPTENRTADRAGMPRWVIPTVAAVAAAAMAVGAVWGVGAWLRRRALPVGELTASAVSAVSLPPSTTEPPTTAEETTAAPSTTATTAAATTTKNRTTARRRTIPTGTEPSDPKQEQAPRTTRPQDSRPMTLERVRQELGGAGQLLGVDVWRQTADTPIDWRKVKAAGITFAMIRVGGRSYGTDEKNGAIYADSKFDENMRGALAAGIQVGVYFYSAAISRQEAEDEADYVLSKIAPYGDKITWPVAYDFEAFDLGRVQLCLNPPDNPTGNSKKLLATKGRIASYTDVTDNAIAFLEKVAQAGYTPMLYTYRNVLWQKFETGRLGKYRIWLAQYVSQLSSKRYGGPHAVWQCASDGRVDGIRGRVDVNIAYENLYNCAEKYVTPPEWTVTMEFEPTEDTVESIADHLGLRLSPDAELPNRYATGCKGQRFRRTGVNAENGWSRLVLEDGTVVYASNDYLTDPSAGSSADSSGENPPDNP